VPARFISAESIHGRLALFEGLEGEIDADSSGGHPAPPPAGAVKSNTTAGGITRVDCTGRRNCRNERRATSTRQRAGRTVLRTRAQHLVQKPHGRHRAVDLRWRHPGARGGWRVSAHTSGGGIEAAFKAGLKVMRP
jgi:hypothetical protein